MMSGTGNNTPEGTSVDPPVSTVNGETHTRVPARTNSERVTTPIDVTDLSSTLSKALIED